MTDRGRLGSLILGLAALLAPSLALGASDGAPVPAAAYTAQLRAAQALSQACAARADACTATDLPAQERVEEGTQSYMVRWSWLSNALLAAKTASPEDRVRAMAAVEGHLRELADESGPLRRETEASDEAVFPRAQAAARAALARDEFQASEGPGWLARKLARLQDWFLRLFTGMDRLGRRAPWLAPAIEWSCFGLAVAGLLLFVWRNLQRQALRIALTEGAAPLGSSSRPAEDWERLAATQAEAGAWRDAVHSLYWAGVALLEARRAWRPNAARTPRESLRLLRRSSEAEVALRALTGELERVWYGAAEAGEAAFRRAEASLQALRVAKPERGASETEAGAAIPAAAGGL